MREVVDATKSPDGQISVLLNDGERVAVPLLALTRIVAVIGSAPKGAPQKALSPIRPSGLRLFQHNEEHGLAFEVGAEYALCIVVPRPALPELESAVADLRLVYSATGPQQ
jgi:hypothetical protein